MGLDAKVRCCCWEQGRLTPPPLPDRVHLDEEGWPRLDLPWDDAHRADHQAFEQWLESCCPHPKMDFADERIGNVGGISLFLGALARAGEERFPTLVEGWPVGNGGHLPLESALLALEELRLFERADHGSGVFLVDSGTGEELRRADRSGDGVFFWGGGCGQDVGLDPRGLFIVERDGAGAELFRSMRFEQEPVEPDAARLVDVETGRSSLCPLRLGERWDDPTHPIPRNLHVASRRLTAADYAYITEPLARILEAAVVTGHPVVWY